MPRAAVMDPALFDAEKSAVQDLRNVQIIDMTSQLCQHDICKATQNGLVMYRDSHHLTGRYTASLAPVLGPELAAALAR